MNRDDLIYTAAIIDGEGSIFISRHRDIRNRAGYYNELRISLGMTDPTIPHWLKSLWGGHIHIRNGQKLAHRDMHIWAISAKKAQTLLELALPHFKIKILQAKLGIEFQTIKSIIHYHYRNPKPPENYNMESTFVEAMGRLNKKGSGG